MLDYMQTGNFFQDVQGRSWCLKALVISNVYPHIAKIFFFSFLSGQVWPSRTLWNLPRRDPSPISSSLRYQVIMSDAHFLSRFADANKTPTKWKNLTPWWPWALSPQTCWGLSHDNVTPRCSLTISPSENCAWGGSCTLRLRCLTRPLKILS